LDRSGFSAERGVGGRGVATRLLTTVCANDTAIKYGGVWRKNIKRETATVRQAHRNMANPPTAFLTSGQGMSYAQIYYVAINKLQDQHSQTQTVFQGCGGGVGVFGKWRCRRGVKQVRRFM